MTPRIVLVSSRLSLLALGTSALIAGLACGKYGKPERIAQPEPPVAARVDMSVQTGEQTGERTSEQEREEDGKSRKP